MEELLFVGMMSLQGLFWGGMLLALIVLAFRRAKIKKREDFEDRDN